jgi:hypothetical protein
MKYSKEKKKLKVNAISGIFNKCANTMHLEILK